VPEHSPGIRLWRLLGSISRVPFGRPWDEVPDRLRTDTRLTFLSSDETWSAAFFVDNLFDETYIRWADMEPRRTGYGMNYPHRAVALEPFFIVRGLRPRPVVVALGEHNRRC
jgi:hypothetical protein